jgi:DNA repair exonuclease SbcCD ATPase subunit
MITFHTIRWKNFLSTGNVYNEIPLDKYPNALIIGSNGAGKSTILDALTFSLFGKSFRKINKGNLVNSVNNKECVVEIEFSTNGKKYKVVRGIKPAIFEIWCNGVCLNQDSATKDYQEHLEKFILKMNYKSFTQIVILGSASFTPFMQLSAADRRAVIEDLLDIQVFSVMNKIVKQRSQDNKQSVEKNKMLIVAKREKIAFITKTIDSLSKQNDNKTKEIAGELSGLKDRKIVCEESIESYEKQKDDIKSQLKDVDKLRKKHTKLIQLHTKIKANLEDHKEKSSFYDSHDDCPVCKQNLDPTFKTEQIEKHSTEITKIENGLTDLETQIKTCVASIKECEEEQRNIRDIDTKIVSIQAEVSSLQKRIDAITQSMNKENEFDALVKSNSQELESAKDELTKLEEEQKSLLDEHKYIQTSLELLKDDGIKTKIVKQYLPIINQQINKFLSLMGFLVKFEINEQFEEVIKSRYRDEFSYQNFSEGEKMRIDLAILLTWRHIAKIRNSCSTNLLIMDEIFDSSLDVNGIDEFVKIMWNIINDTNVIIISHKQDQMMDKFNKIFEFKKVKNFSRLVSE